MTHPTDLVFRLPAGRGLHLHLRCQPAPQAHGDALYVHGATFPSDLSLFFRFDGRSWADALNDAGLNAWGLDLLGYGRSDRYPEMADPASTAPPLGRADAAQRQLEQAVRHILSHNGGRALHLIAHSWGSVPAARLAIRMPQFIDRLVLFGPIAERETEAPAADLPAHRLFTLWAQYRRFIEDVPRGHAPVLLDHHIEAWSRAYLASDPQARLRTPPAVCVPAGPSADILDHWGGRPLYDPAGLTMPLLLVRGEWDSLCDDADAARLLARAGSALKRDCKIARGTHLMHLETSRSALHEAVNAFLCAGPARGR
jgi:alpha-beta hydrolase superfamily lysophospholipase